MKALEYIANKAHTLAAWKLEPSGHDVSIAELQEIETKAREALTVARDLLKACKMAVREFGPDSDGVQCWQAFEMLQKAIAKAEPKE